MTTDIEPARFRLSTPSDIVAAVPYLLGFEPADSLVVLSLKGARRRVGLTARVDLPLAEVADACARTFAGYLKRDRALAALVVFYPPSGGCSHPAIGPLSAAITKRFASARIEIGDMLCVYEGRWWSLHCTDDACCPSGGTMMSLEAPPACAAAMTVSGRVVFGSRDELARTIDPVSGAVQLAMAYALPRISAQLGLRPHDDEVAAESIQLFRAAVQVRLVVARGGGGDTALGVDETARLIAGLDDGRLRDEILAWYDGEEGEATRQLLVELVKHAVPPYHVPVLTTLAWLAYLQGDGGFAGIAVDRALGADAGNRFALLLDQVLTVPINPDVFRPALKAKWPP
jgi:hypothetical protein